MRSHSLPIDIITEIAMYLPPPDRVSMAFVCKRWNSRLYPVVLHTVTLLTRQKLASFLCYLEKYKDVGRHVKKLYFKNNMGLEPELYLSICKECALLVSEFSSWRNYQMGGLAEFPRLQQIPEGLDALDTCGKALTRLLFTESLMLVLASHFNIIEILKRTPHLTHLELHGSNSYTAENLQLQFDGETWNMLQQHYIHLESIKMGNFTLKSLSPTTDESKLISVFKNENMKSLSFTNVHIQDHQWLQKIVSMYPKLTYLKLDFDNLSSTHLQQDRPHINVLDFCNGFLLLGAGLRYLKHVEFLNLDATHFPGASYFEILANTGVQLNEVALHFNKSVLVGTHGFVYFLSTYNALLRTQQSTLRGLDLKVYHNEDISTVIVEPMSICKRLSKLKLECGFIFMGRQLIAIDTLLDTCPHLQELSLKRFEITYTDKTTLTNRKHPLKSLDIHLTHINEPLFAYLSTHCSQITHMSVENCILKSLSRNRIKINMTNNVFQSVCIKFCHVGNDERGTLSITSYLTSAILLEQNNIAQGKRARYIERNDSNLDIASPNIDSTWYCEYNYNAGNHVRKLRRKESIACFEITDKMKGNQAPIENFRMDQKRPWKTEVQKVYIHFICKSVDKLMFNHVNIVYR